MAVMKFPKCYVQQHFQAVCSVLLASLFSASLVQAGFISDHAGTFVRGEGYAHFDGSGGSVNDGGITSGSGPVYSRSDDSFSAVGSDGFSSSSGSATSELGTTWSLSSYATAAAAAAVNARATMYGNSQATWDDVIFLSSTAPGIIGNTLRITFRAEGLVEAAGGDANRGSAYNTKNVRAYSDNNASADATVIAQTDFGSEYGFTSYGGWDSITAVGGAYSGTFYIDIPIFDNTSFLYSTVAGNIGLSIFSNSWAEADTNGYAGSASATAWDPLFFQSITLPDMGNVTPESLGVSLTFDSGMLSPNLVSRPVPEPSTLLMASILWALAGIGRTFRCSK